MFAGMARMSDIVIGPPKGRPDPDEAKARTEIAHSQLDNARKSAEGWRNGVAALLGLIATVSILKGPESIEGLPNPQKGLVGIFIGLALFLAVVATVRATKAAFGDPEPLPLGPSVADWKLERAREAGDLVRVARWCISGAISLLALAVAVRWYTPNEPPAVVTVTSGDVTVCGVPEIRDARLIVRNGNVTNVVAIAGLKSIVASGSCDSKDGG